MNLFRCPDCGETRLEEVMVNVTTASTITALDEGGDAEYGSQSHEGGVTVRFQCINCGWSINSDVDNTEELFDYLTSREIHPGHVDYERPIVPKNVPEI